MISRIDVLTNSSPIDRAPGADSKSVEFVETSILVFKIASISCEITSRLCCTFWDPESLTARDQMSALAGYIQKLLSSYDVTVRRM